MRGVRVKVHIREVEKLKRHPKVQRRMERDAKGVAQEAQRIARRVLDPSDPGGGIASIHAEKGDPRQGSWFVGADALHYWMDFHELGTGDFPPTPFLRPALEGYESFVHEYFSGF
jgi:hypothetical protein